MEEKKLSQEIFNTMSLLLAEKRTSLAVLRTGIAIFTLPTSVFTVLIATSKYYDISTVTFFIVPLVLICIVFLMLGTFFIIRSFRKIKDVDHKIQEIKKEQKNIKELIDTC